MEEHCAEILCTGVVRGTPRTYGDTKRDDNWRRTIVEGDWEGVETLVGRKILVHLDFSFRVNPCSPAYWGRRWDNGPDLDTMVIGALDGLVHCRNPARPTLRLIQERGLCRQITAKKSIVESDESTGFTLVVRAGNVVPFCEPRNTALSFFVGRQALKKDRRRAVQFAAEQQNARLFRVPRGSQIAVYLAFANGITRNPLSADWLEAVIDGLGASRVGAERFFDGPSTQEFGYDDSVVYKLIVSQVTGMPTDIGLHISCDRLDGRSVFSADPFNQVAPKRLP
jgi:hypothetical protein